MKYIVVLGDGMADKPIEELGNKTPLEYADTPTMDRLSKVSEVGLVHTYETLWYKAVLYKWKWTTFWEERERCIKLVFFLKSCSNDKTWHSGVKVFW